MLRRLLSEWRSLEMGEMGMKGGGDAWEWAQVRGGAVAGDGDGASR